MDETQRALAELDVAYDIAVKNNDANAIVEIIKLRLSLITQAS